MPRAETATSRGRVEHYSDALAQLREPGDYVMVVRGMPRSIVMRCPEGCGECVTVNLDRRTGPAWKTYQKAGRLTVYPSIWRDTGCKAHFIVWRNEILWCDRAFRRPSSDEELLRRVRNSLPSVKEVFRHFEQIASELSEEPWDVLWACQALERRGVATSAERGTRFRATAEGGGPGGRVDLMA